MLINIIVYISVKHTFCHVKANNKDVDATQEMIALGCCNIAGSFVRAMPVTGSFTRTAINHVSGVKTPLGGTATGERFNLLSFPLWYSLISNPL